jgi:hypothetical protein
MAKVTRKEIPPVPVEKKYTYTLELDQDEAEALTAMCGAVSSTDKYREATSRVYDTLVTHGRIPYNIGFRVLNTQDIKFIED